MIDPVRAAAIRRRIRIPLRFADGTALHLTGSNAAYLATKARRGGHDLLSRSLEHAAEPRPDAGPLPGPAGPGFEAR